MATWLCTVALDMCEALSNMLREPTSEQLRNGAIVGQQRGQVQRRDAARPRHVNAPLVAARRRPPQQQLHLLRADNCTLSTAAMLITT